MAHEIFGTRFMGRSVPAWHKLGEVFSEDEHVTVTDAVKRVGGDFEVQKVPITVKAFGEEVLTDQFALMRAPTMDDPEPRFLACVGSDYEHVSNLDGAAILDPLAAIWPLNTAGVLGKGERFFASLKVRRADLAGKDVVDIYYMLYLNHGTGQSNYCTIGTVRPVCANTVAMNLSSARELIAVPHKPGAKADLAVATTIMAQLQQADTETVDALTRMALKEVSAAQVARIVEAAYPVPKEPTKVALLREAAAAGIGDQAQRFASAQERFDAKIRQSVERRRMAGLCYERLNDCFPSIAGTAWAAFNAVTEVENHLRGGDERQTAYSIMLGNRAETMGRALRVAADLSSAR